MKIVAIIIALAALAGCSNEVADPDLERGATVLPDADVTVDASFAEYRAPIPITADRRVTVAAPAEELLEAEPDLRVRFTKDHEDYRLAVANEDRDLCYVNNGFGGFCEIAWIDGSWVRSAWGQEAW